MEVRASYTLVGAFVLAILAALAVFVIWLARVQIDQSFAEYEVAFTGTVNGLQQGSSVRYRGVPVGRVSSIRIDPDNIGQVLVGLELQPGTPIRTDTIAVVEAQGITGIATIQLTGGMQGSPVPEEDGSGTPPRIMAGRSTLEQVFDSTPVVLNRIAGVLERLGTLLNDENLASINGILDDLEELIDKVGESEPQIRALLTSVTNTADRLRTTSDEFSGLAADMRGAVGGIDGRLARLEDQGRSTLEQTAGAASAFRTLANRLDRLVRENQDPIGDFSQSTLYEIRQLVAEMRQLVASGSRISKEFERDPAGYLFGAQQKGFQPQ
jgi:phospholipid/cholesterol/gamma-HCH transport system substrate-binding protein